jgi:hypothetical protein
MNAHEVDQVGPGNSAACTCGVMFNAGTQPKAYASLLRHISQFQNA